MRLVVHNCNGVVAAEVSSLDEKISDASSALDVFASAQHSAKTQRIILNARDLDPSFFDLSTGLAGEILQKVSNYHLQVAIVGDYSKVGSRALRDFIRESNNYGQVVFVADIDSAVVRLCKPRKTPGSGHR